jgi:hypothetical protein
VAIGRVTTGTVVYSTDAASADATEVEA